MGNAHNFIDLTGNVYGDWTVLNRTANNVKPTRWDCKCKCGNVVSVRAGDLRHGKSTKCKECRLQEHTKLTIERNTKHNLAGTPLYITWKGIKSRTCNPNSEQYKDYGGRGINICDDWEHNYLAFYNWAMENGYQEDLTIDRIDNDKGYSPDNCRWIDMIGQANNRRSNRFVVYNGKEDTVSNWCRTLGLNAKTVSQRLNKCKWSVEKAFETPTKKVR